MHFFFKICILLSFIRLSLVFQIKKALFKTFALRDNHNVLQCLILTTSRSWDRRMPSLTVSWTVLFPVGLISLLYFSLSKNSWSFFSAGSWPRVPNPRTITKALATKNHFESILKSILLQAFLERHSLACLTLAYIPVRLIRLPGESICTAIVYSFQQ